MDMKKEKENSRGVGQRKNAVKRKRINERALLWETEIGRMRNKFGAKGTRTLK